MKIPEWPLVLFQSLSRTEIRNWLHDNPDDRMADLVCFAGSTRIRAERYRPQRRVLEWTPSQAILRMDASTPPAVTWRLRANPAARVARPGCKPARRHREHLIAGLEHPRRTGPSVRTLHSENNPGPARPLQASIGIMKVRPGAAASTFRVAALEHVPSEQRLAAQTEMQPTARASSCSSSRDLRQISQAAMTSQSVACSRPVRSARGDGGAGIARPAW